MDNKYNLSIKSEILERQADYIFRKAQQKLGKDVSEQEVAALAAETIRRYYTNLGRPLTIKRYAESGHLPFIEEYNDLIEEMTEDISILFNEVENIGDFLSDYFNYAQSEKARVQHRVRGMTGLVNDLNLISNDTYGGSVYFRDSFDDLKNIEASMTMGTPAQVSTIEGVVTLGRTNTTNRSNNSTIKAIQGNGEEGTEHIARRVALAEKNSKGEIEIIQNIEYMSEKIPNNKPESVLDGRPDTVYEYQMVNVPQNFIKDTAKGYDFEWVRGKQNNDKLRLKMTIELEGVVDINWININPYNAPYSTGKVSVYSLRTSADGFDYQGLYEGGSYILNSELNTTPQSYRLDAIFDGKNDFNESKFAGQGVWVFPTRKARYVEVVFDQIESYEELIGHTYYLKIKKSPNGDKQSEIRIPASQAPKNVVEGKPGTYNIDSETQIVKMIEATEGWRYAIGIRDINIMSYEFAEKSEIVTKRFETEQPIKELMLYVNEKIPASYLDVLATSNDWIQYYISTDDVNWTRISPMHHQPTTKDKFPPKIIHFNGSKIDLESSFQLYKEYVETEEPVRGVRLKVIMQRPTDIENSSFTTPVLEDYAIRVVFNDGLEG